MLTPRQYSYLRAHLAVTLLAIAGLASAGALTLEYAFVVAFLWLVVLTALTAPVAVTPAWRRRLRWPLLAGGGVFLALVALRTVDRIVASL